METNFSAAAFIETPCPTRWEKMEGSNTVRFCALCNLSVYNIADMTDKEAEETLSRGIGAGKMCAVLYRRADGKLMTDNCPRSLRKIRDISRWVKLKIVAATALLMAMVTPAQAQNQKQHSSEAKKMPTQLAPHPVPQTTSQLTPPQMPVPGGVAVRFTDDSIYKEEIVHRILQTWMDANSNPPVPVVKFKINQKGVVSELKIVTSSGSSDIDRAALKAIARKSPFTPPPAGARLPVEIEVRLTPERREK